MGGRIMHYLFIIINNTCCGLFHFIPDENDFTPLFNVFLSALKCCRVDFPHIFHIYPANNWVYMGQTFS